MQQYCLILIPLVVTCPLIAHGRTFQLNKDFMTSLLAKKDAAFREMDENNLDLDNVVLVRTPSSAVQDWSLVCQQLCGAALGGATCAPFCKNLPFLPYEVQFQNAEDILDSKQDLICRELCGLQLGDDVCTCKNYITDDDHLEVSDDKPKINVCATFCDHKRVTLTGCTPCDENNQKEENNENNKKLNLNKFQNFSQKEVAVYEATTLTTPNWNDICAALCKTGDGGSLCNCDLSPF